MDSVGEWCGGTLQDLLVYTLMICATLSTKGTSQAGPPWLLAFDFLHLTWHVFGSNFSADPQHWPTFEGLVGSRPP